PADGLEQRHYVQHDANFNVTAITDPTGTVAQRYEYDPYGQATVLTGNWQPTTGNSNWQYLHQGGRYDPATALYHFRNRDYSAELGRWDQQDPLGYVDGMSLYHYLQSSPADLLDPQGLHWTDWPPIVGTVKNIFTNPEGSDVEHYARFKPTRERCRQSGAAVAEQKCTAQIDSEAMRLLVYYEASGLGRSGIEAAVGIGIGQAKKGGKVGAISGAVIVADGALNAVVRSEE